MLEFVYLGMLALDPGPDLSYRRLVRAMSGRILALSFGFRDLIL
jgi:hypothetical protein